MPGVVTVRALFKVSDQMLALDEDLHEELKSVLTPEAYERLNREEAEAIRRFVKGDRHDMGGPEGPRT